MTQNLPSLLKCKKEKMNTHEPKGLDHFYKHRSDLFYEEKKRKEGLPGRLHLAGNSLKGNHRSLIVG